MPNQVLISEAKSADSEFQNPKSEFIHPILYNYRVLSIDFRLCIFI